MSISDQEWYERLRSAIPGGAHTYSKGSDQYPSNAPSILSRGKGAYVWSPDDKKFLDYGMGLRSVILGYDYEPVTKAAIQEIRNGNSLSRPTVVELFAAEKIIDLIPSAQMVKFAKNGSNVTTAANKMARAYTGRNFVCVPNQQPFFSFDDWFIGSTAVGRGVPLSHHELTLRFDYGSIESLEELFKQHPNEIAAVMLEPAFEKVPCPTSCEKNKSLSINCRGCSNSFDNFLVKVQDLCKREGAVFILDEMRTGFRWHLQGAQAFYGVTPDLSTFGKALANGFSIAALVGRREIMELASIHKEGTERTFLLSSTHGAEMSSLGALVATLKELEENQVSEYLWDYGRKLRSMVLDLTKELGISNFFTLEGPDVALEIKAYDKHQTLSPEYRTLFLQEMARRGVLVASGNSFAPSFAHGQAELELTRSALQGALAVYAKALESNIELFLEGPAVKPVFRKFN